MPALLTSVSIGTDALHHAVKDGFCSFQSSNVRCLQSITEEGGIPVVSNAMETHNVHNEVPFL